MGPAGTGGAKGAPIAGIDRCSGSPTQDRARRKVGLAETEDQEPCRSAAARLIEPQEDLENPFMPQPGIEGRDLVRGVGRRRDDAESPAEICILPLFILGTALLEVGTDQFYPPPDLVESDSASGFRVQERPPAT